MTVAQQKTLVGLGLLGVVLVGSLAVLLVAAHWNNESEEASPVPTAANDGEEEGQSVVSVKTIHPKRDPSFTIGTYVQPAIVEAYYQADLKARVAGPVKFIQKDIGDRVKEGEVLAEIDLPDLWQAVDQAEAVILQKEKDKQFAEQKVKSSEAAAEVAYKDIALKTKLVARAKATMDLRYKRWNRFIAAAKDKAVDPAVVDEEERDYLAAEADWEGAKAAVDKAELDWKEALANIEVAKADVKLKQALVDVAKKDKERAEVLAKYTRVIAPFDGVITARQPDPGSFVQVASPVYTVERTDIVTVYGKVPDNWCAYVTTDTEVDIDMSELPGQIIHGKVTRRSPSLANPQNDRTMRVEVDLYNGTQEEYNKFLQREKSPELNRRDLKGQTLPLLPKISSKDTSSPSRSLLPGMYGGMRLVFHKLGNVYLIPSEAIVHHGGTAYVYLVAQGKAHLVPVEVQVNDQKVAKIVLISNGSHDHVLRELTGAEEIVATNQGELSDGQAVKSTLVGW